MQINLGANVRKTNIMTLSPTSSYRHSPASKFQRRTSCFLAEYAKAFSFLWGIVSMGQREDNRANLKTSCSIKSDQLASPFQLWLKLHETTIFKYFNRRSYYLLSWVLLGVKGERSKTPSHSKWNQTGVPKTIKVIFLKCVEFYYQDASLFIECY